MKKYEELCISSGSTILVALKQMDTTHRKLLIVTKDGQFYNLLSIGDIQRAILKGEDLNNPLDGILRTETNVATIHQNRAEIEQYVRAHKTEFMPIVDDNQQLVDVIFWEDIFHTRVDRHTRDFNLPVVIMAGGQGSRLRPLTNVLPKPLIPIGDQTLMEDIMDRFVECGCHNFYVSVNYKADFIRRYFDNLDKPQYHIEYFQEDKPLGTAGSLHLLKERIKKTFFVSNCDIIIDEDYSEILDYHQQNNNEITVVAALRNYSIPYGTLETSEGGLLTSLTEKPNLTFKINTGMYILEPHLINEIPSDRLYHITFLIEKLINEGRKVGVFPISEGSWTDIGNWSEYLKIIRAL
jgi:Nucleoside-diphosphate-sugar pyrophosphorylase involved in lipopolysaccharide biosynthesis/translation initiation factor 2B, gamma/epsilon subunits (eIF-2Bgamma/eIF-2Bepsilon)